MITIGTTYNHNRIQMKSGIYIIQSISKPERIYVGSAVSLRSRKLRHFRELHLQKHHSAKLQNHYNKYGPANLDFIILEYCSKDLLIHREQYYLHWLKPYFNINPVAGSRLGAKHSNQSKLLISQQSKKSPKESILCRYARLTSKKPSYKRNKVESLEIKFTSQSCDNPPVTLKN